MKAQDQLRDPNRCPRKTGGLSHHRPGGACACSDRFYGPPFILNDHEMNRFIRARAFDFSGDILRPERLAAETDNDDPIDVRVGSVADQGPF